MADNASDNSWAGRFSRFLRSDASGPVAIASPTSADQAPARPEKRNGKHHFIEAKSSIDLLPRGLQEVDADFFSSDGGRTFVFDRDDPHAVSIAFVAYWFCATRWRAQKIAEAPLMVVKEDQKDGSEDWLADHELANVLDSPSPDYDMGELLERTSRYLDDGGQCLWKIDRDRIGRVARLTPFRRGEFSVEKTPDRLYGKFTIETARGPLPVMAEDACYFRDMIDGWTTDGKSRLDVALSWLRLGEKARETIRDLLDNAVWPSIVAVPDKDWNPGPEDQERYKQELNSYARRGQKGKAFAMLGGGTIEQLPARVRDLVPEELLNRVESVVAAVSGVPAIVLQFQVGMENSPWSQMEQARRMAYDDTIQPAWRRIERVLTRQLLRPEDEDTTHFIRFDRSTIASLQVDRQAAATIANLMGRDASLNERRIVMQLEPLDDEAADKVPALEPMPNPFTGETGEENTKARRGVPALHSALRDEARNRIEASSQRLLREDANEIERIINSRSKSVKASSAFDVNALMDEIIAYLRQSEKKWTPLVIQELTQSTERATAVVAADLGIGFNQLHPHIVDFANREAAKLITGVSETTRKTVADTIARGISEGKTVPELARMVSESGAFSDSRALLIAQTECLLPETRVDAAVVRAVFRRWYDGDVVHIKTRNGREFTTTPNHPMLTRRGWVAASELNERDDLICNARQQHAGVSGDVDIERSPATIAQIFDSAQAIGVAERRGGGKPDFHGDGRESEIDVSIPDRLLHIGNFSALSQPLLDDVLAPSDTMHAAFCEECAGLLPVNPLHHVCERSECFSGFDNTTGDGSPVDSKRSGDVDRGLSGAVATENLVVRESLGIAGMAAFSVAETLGNGIATGDSSGLYGALHPVARITETVGHLTATQPALIELDRVRSIRVSMYSGHVFNLETSDGYFNISGAYTGNTTKAFAGGPTEALQELSRKTKRRFVKRWKGKLDEKERPEHIALEGETRYVTKAFSNGLQFPSEPNCRCELVFSEVTDE